MTSARRFDRGRRYQTYPVKLQVCLDVALYNDIQNRMLEENHSNVSEFIRKLLKERFNIEDILTTEKAQAVKDLTNVIFKREHSLNERVKTIVDHEQKIAQLEKQIRILERKVKE